MYNPIVILKIISTDAKKTRSRVFVQVQPTIIASLGSPPPTHICMLCRSRCRVPWLLRPRTRRGLDDSGRRRRRDVRRRFERRGHGFWLLAQDAYHSGGGVLVAEFCADIGVVDCCILAVVPSHIVSTPASYTGFRYTHIGDTTPSSS